MLVPFRSISTARPFGWRQIALVVAGAVLSLAILLRVQIETGFVQVTGDIYDGRIEVSLLQHWFNVMGGREHWSRTAYFYPLNDTLGFNDGYLLFGLVFSLFRLFGVEPMLASDLVNVVVRMVGYGSFIAVATDLCGLPLLWATLGAVLFTISNGMMLQEGHQQLLSVCFAPLLVWLLGQAWRALPTRPRRAAAWGSTAALLYSGWLLTAFYMAWFTTFYGCMVLLLLLVFAGRPGRRHRRTAIRRLMAWPSAVTVVVLLVSSVPFLRVYLPAARLTGQHPFATAFDGLPAPRDLLRLGPDNLLFGWMESILNRGLATPPGGEWQVGFPPVLWLAALAGASLAWGATGRRNGRGLWSDARLASPRVWAALAIASVAAIGLCLKVDDATAWRFVYVGVPGAAALRQETRFLLLLDLPLVALAMLAMAWLARRLPVALTAALATLLVLGEINLHGAQHLNRPEERAVTDRVPAVPQDCRSFYVVTRGHQPQAGSPEMDGLYHHEVDAMMLAEERALPTVNGFATFTPAEVLVINQLPVSLGEIRDYAKRHDIWSGLCGLDLDNDRWITAPLTPPTLPETGIRFGGDADNAHLFLRKGWSHPEADGQWTDQGKASLDVVLPREDSGRSLRLAVSALPFFPPHGDASAVRVLANGREIARWTPLAGQQGFEAILPPDLSRLPLLTLEFVIERPTTPRSTDGTPDDRALGMRFRSLSISPSAGG